MPLHLQDFREEQSCWLTVRSREGNSPPYTHPCGAGLFEKAGQNLSDKKSHRENHGPIKHLGEVARTLLSFSVVPTGRAGSWAHPSGERQLL